MAKKRRKAGRRRSRVSGLNKQDLTGVAIAAVIGGVGAVAGKMVLNNLLPNQFAQHVNYAQIGGGILIAAFFNNPMVQAAGLGIATVGAANVVSDLADGQSVNGLLPYGVPSVRISGLSEQPSGVTTL